MSSSPTVTVNGCTVVGAFQAASPKYPKALDLFHGIPFASAQRFSPAVAMPLDNQASGLVIDASRPAPSQPFPMAPHATAEDPLSLNIVRPSFSASTFAVDDDGDGDLLAAAIGADAETRRDLPVVVYVHGGAFNFGFPEERDLASFVAWGRNQVLVVSISYRLGALGFLSGSSAKGLTSNLNLNLGLRDQRTAVEWVRQWIGEFGGDVDDITLWGSSAGAHSVGHHMLSPSRLPFHKAILESGSPTARSILSPSHPRNIAQLNELAMYADNNPLDSLPVDSLIQASFAVYATHHTAVTWPFQPVIDGPGGIIPDLPLNLWRDLVSSGRAKELAVITGFCSHEGTTFAPQHASTSAEFRSFFQKLIPAFSADDLDALELLYPDPLIDPDSPYRQPPGIGGPQKRPYGAQFRRIHEAYGHYAYICPILHTAHTLSRAGARVYVYEYAALSSPFKAASHSDQPPAVTHDVDVLEFTPGLVATAKEMNHRWISFASSPSGTLDQSDEDERWPEFQSPLGDDSSSSSSPAAGGPGLGEILVFGDGNDEAAGGRNQGTPVKTRTLTKSELEQCRFWWDRMELSQGMGERGAATAWLGRE
ncbi:alpha/beta-hydrolase [Trichoderma austrokoningii]